MPHGKLLVSYRVTRDNMTTFRTDRPRVKMFYILPTAKHFQSSHVRTVKSGSTVATNRSRRRDLQCFFALSPEVETRCSMATFAGQVLQQSQTLLVAAD